MIGEKLKTLRENNQLRQYELAELIGISQKNICAVEKRDDIYLSSLKKYVEALGGSLKIYVEFKKEELLYDLSSAIK
ncbi:helix-turn-helix domain-containing protein [Legionella fairfieldensis]|uniref:helix-turn-helix domain-containing protein n=1 Tax=Legionella fairfieldensis TaxID=45064 RepID=UPI00055ED4B9|nr:helix-turn-helix transcriptional regulator [Legionella fairfieldensis]